MKKFLFFAIIVSLFLTYAISDVINTEKYDVYVEIDTTGEPMLDSTIITDSFIVEHKWKTAEPQFKKILD